MKILKQFYLEFLVKFFHISLQEYIKRGGKLKLSIFIHK